MFGNRLFLVPYPFVSSYRHCTDRGCFRVPFRVPRFVARQSRDARISSSSFCTSKGWYRLLFPGSLCCHHGLSFCEQFLFIIRVSYNLRDVQTVGQFRGFKPLVSIAERVSVVAWKRSNMCCVIPDVQMDARTLFPMVKYCGDFCAPNISPRIWRHEHTNFQHHYLSVTLLIWYIK